VAYKLGFRNYTYGLLGDDSLDSNRKFYKLYHKILKQLGVNISDAKCTTSNNGSCEFAKRIFRKNKEVTGLPVKLLSDLEIFPEQFLELIKTCRHRGYRDKKLRPGVLQLIETMPKPTQKQLLDLLALPSRLTNQAPILEVMNGTFAATLLCLSEREQNMYLKYARDVVF